MSVSSKQHILLIEDDFETQFLFAEMLRMENYEVTVKGDGLEAIEYLKTDSIQPDLVITDLTFPHSTPEQFLTSLMGIIKKDIPLIIVSGRDNIQDYARDFASFASFKKPFDIDSILSTIKEVFLLRASRLAP